MPTAREQAGDDRVSGLDSRDARADLCHRSGVLVAQDDGEWHVVLAGVEEVIGVADAGRL